MASAGIDPINSLNIYVEKLQSEHEYQFSIQKLNAEMMANKIAFRWNFETWLEDIQDFNPLNMLQDDSFIANYVNEYRDRIELFLPEDPIACLDWESLGRGRVSRRTPRNYSFLRPPIITPLRVGIVSTVGFGANACAEVADAIAEHAAAGVLDVGLVDVRDWDHFREVNRIGRHQALHVFLKTEITPSGPIAVVGGDQVPLGELIKSVVQPGMRAVVLQDVNENRRSIGALRWGAQSLPEDSEASLLLCNAAPSADFSEKVKSLYGDLLGGEPLGQCLAHLDTEQEAGGVSLVAHTGAHRGLDLFEEVGMRRRRRSQIGADFSRLLEPSGVSAQLGPGPSTGPIASLTELSEPDFLADEATNELKEKRQSLVTENQPRYPAAWFYYVDAASRTSVPDTETLTWPPPVGVALEFHFWLDIVRTGIASITDPPIFDKPESVPYPLALQVTLWSDDFEFASRDREIILQSSGPTEHAIFPISKVRSAPRRAELFVFVRHKGALIAVFRIETIIGEETERQEGAQIIEHAYLANDWFRFEDAPASSALTIFITKSNGALQVFTLKSTGDPWATVGQTVSGLYEKNKAIYKEIQLLARRAAQASNKKLKFNFFNEAKQLAKLGYPLFGDIFLQGDEELNVFATEYVRRLPDGADVTIAIGAGVQDLYVPWGLLYDRAVPLNHFDAPELQGFLGYRYNLVVRPSILPRGLKPRRQLPIRIGAAWLGHKETDLLEDHYRPYETSGKLQIEAVKVENNALPALVSKDFDIVEFFCHGHTMLSSMFTKDEREEIIQNYAKNTDKNEGNSLLMAIDQAGDSLLELNGGIVTLTGLADGLKTSMPGRPVILLSMCESAQVSAGGTGFVPLFLRRGARAVIGTEGPTLWALSREMDAGIIDKLLDGESIGRAFYETRRTLAKTNMLALIYTLYGDASAKLV